MKKENLSGEEKITITKKSKKKIIIAAVALALVLLIAVGGILISANQTAVYTQALYTLMPKELPSKVGENEEKEITIYVRKNPDFDPVRQAKAPLAAFEYYYYDDDGNEVNLGYDGSLVYDDVDYGPPFLAFVIEAKNNLESVKSVVTKCVIVLALIIVVVLIYIWFKSWSKREDEKIANQRKKHNNKKKK